MASCDKIVTSVPCHARVMACAYRTLVLHAAQLWGNVPGWRLLRSKTYWKVSFAAGCFSLLPLLIGLTTRDSKPYSLTDQVPTVGVHNQAHPGKEGAGRGCISAPHKLGG
jgi:hypothetical protein